MLSSEKEASECSRAGTSRLCLPLTVAGGGGQAPGTLMTLGMGCTGLCTYYRVA